MKDIKIASRRPAPGATPLDWSYLNKLVKEVTHRELPTPAKFSIYALRYLFGLSEDEALEAKTDGSGDRGVDAIVLDATNKDVHILQFKYREAEDHISKQFPGNSVDKIISLVDDIHRHDRKTLEGCNRLLQAKLNQIWDLIKEGPVRIHIHLAGNARKLESKERERLCSALKKYDACVWEYTAAELTKRHPGKKDRRRISFTDIGRLEHASSGKRMITGVVTLKELTALLTHPETPGQLDHTLFMDNVRGALGLGNEVNRSISKTLFSSDAANFVFLNNGITIVAEQILYQAAGNFPVEMINPQIVNGCQTASTIHEAFFVDQSIFDHLSEAPSVQIRIIESSDPKFTEQVALTTNSQTRIYGRDLRAIDETQKKIERALSVLGYRYLRKRSDQSHLPLSQTVDMAKLGQIILAYYRKQPHIAKTSNAIFGDLYEEIFDLSFVTAGRIAAVHILNCMIEERRQLARQRLRSVDRTQYHEEWILEGYLHVLFVLGLLCDRDGADLSDVKSAALRVGEAIELVGEYVSRHTSVAAYRLFRSAETAPQLSKLVAKTKKQDQGLPQGDLFLGARPATT